MSLKSWRLWLVSCLVLGVLLLGFGFFGQSAISQQSGLQVVSVDSGLSYSGIQAALNSTARTNRIGEDYGAQKRGRFSIGFCLPRFVPVCACDFYVEYVNYSVFV